MSTEWMVEGAHNILDEFKPLGPVGIANMVLTCFHPDAVVTSGQCEGASHGLDLVRLTVIDLRDFPGVGKDPFHGIC